MSPGLRPARGHGTPGIRRTGRKFTYCEKSRRKRSSEPHSEIWSGTVAGQPTAPKKIASNCINWSNQSGGIISPCCV